MGIQKAQRYCRNDNRLVLAERQTPSRILHLLLTLVTAGLWLVVWVPLELFAPAAYRCPACGEKCEPVTRKIRRQLASH